MSSYAMLFEQEFQARLDADARRRERAHTEALRAATAEHDRIREVAESIGQQVELQAALERQQNLEREREALAAVRREADRQALAAQEAELRRQREEEEARRQAEQRKVEAAQEAEAQRRRREQADKEAAEARQRQQQQEEEAAALEAQRRRDEEQRKKTAAQASLAQIQQATPPAPSATAQAPTAPAPAPAQVASADPSREQEHSRYVTIHKNMKELRKWMVEQGKSNPALKQAMGDARREIRKNIGQLTADNKKNIEKRGKIIDLLVQGGRMAEPKIDIVQFLYDPPAPSPQTQVPALLIYLMNIFIKALMRQFIGEGGVKLSTANPVGIIGSYILSFPSLKWEDRPLTDMLLAKFHVACPVLFGIYGPEASDAGKRRIGWKLDKDFTGKAGSWIRPQDHADRMQGLGAGYAALTLRSYERSKQTNPLPPWHFWRSVACIANVPRGEIQPTHCYVLRAMMLDTEARILEFFGDYGAMMLNYALVVFPRKAPGSDPATQQLALLASQLAKDKKLQLAA